MQKYVVRTKISIRFHTPIPLLVPLLYPRFLCFYPIALFFALFFALIFFCTLDLADIVVWNEAQMNRKVNGLAADWGKIKLDN